MLLNRHLHWSTRGTGLAVVALVLLNVGLPDFGLAAQESPCDPELERNTSARPHDYQFRGDRCEGIYAADVSGQALWLASLTERFDSYEFDYEPLLVSWSAPGDPAVRLRAHGVRQGLFYRMDSMRPAGSGSYEWNSELLAVREIGRQDLGVIAWVAGEDGPDLLVPVRVGKEEAVPSEGRSYEAVVVPNVRFREVYVTLARVEAPGDRPTGDLLRNREPLGQRLYATQRPIVIDIQDLGPAGVFYMEVTGVRADEGSATLDPIWFYHPGS